MKKEGDDLREEYDFSRGERGRYVERYSKDRNESSEPSPSRTRQKTDRAIAPEDGPPR
jgi:hypothetical protein